MHKMEVEPHRGCAFSIDLGPGGQFPRRRANPYSGGLPAHHLAGANQPRSHRYRHLLLRYRGGRMRLSGHARRPDGDRDKHRPVWFVIPMNYLSSGCGHPPMCRDGKIVTVSRAQGSLTFPINFQLASLGD